jgi:putative membrane protein
MKRIAAVAIPVLLIASACSQQNDTTVATDTAAPDMTTPAAPALSTVALPDFVTRMAMSDMYEIEASKIAQTKATNPQIKTFARQMINDHSGTSEQLKSLLASETSPPAMPAALDQAHLDRLARLREATAENFDEVYVDQQSEAHENALSLRSYAQNGDNPRIKQFATETATKVQQHLTMVQALDDTGADENKSKS